MHLALAKNPSGVHACKGKDNARAPPPAPAAQQERAPLHKCVDGIKMRMPHKARSRADIMQSGSPA